MAWKPIAGAPNGEPLLIYARGWQPVIAECNNGTWGEHLGGDYYGTRPPFVPTHFQTLKELCEAEELQR